MKQQLTSRLPGVVVVLAMLISGFSQPTHAQQAVAFADPAFQQLWQRTDQLVATGTVKRSYYWGPQPNSGAIYEDYAEGVGGKRLVQYFDKARMEINNVQGDKSDPYYVTNGLLVKEMISGRMQTGTDKYVRRWPAAIPVAGDSNDTTGPTYSNYGSLILNSSPEFLFIDRTGTELIMGINREGRVSDDYQFFQKYKLRMAHFEPATRHNIADVFWNFVNQRGPVLDKGSIVEGVLGNTYPYVTGYPLAEPYWARVKIAGVRTDVLIQPFERRVLTYVPSAPEGFKVQSGNVGQHYYDWRYKDATKPSIPNDCNDGSYLNSSGNPVRGFGKVWSEHEDVRLALGCPRIPEQPIAIVQQSFERGQMLNIVQDEKTRYIYILLNDGTCYGTADRYTTADPDPTDTPPTGLYVPKGSFGRMWSREFYGAVRNQLGWATGPETGLDTGAFQGFQRGQMFYSGPKLRQIYVLFDIYAPSRGNTYFNNNWLAYPDTFSEQPLAQP